MPGKVKVPQCPKCKGPMVYTYAFAKKEYACVACGTTEEFLCKKEEFDADEVESLKQKWSKDLHVIGITKGGGICANPNCDICPTIKEYKFEYYLKGKKKK